MNKHSFYLYTDLAGAKSDCVVVGIYEDGALTPSAGALDKAAKGVISRLIKSGDIVGKAGANHLLHEVSGVSAPRVMVVGLGKAEGKAGAKREKDYHKAITECAKALLDKKFEVVVNTLPQSFPAKQAGWAINTAIVATERALNKYPALRKKEEKVEKNEKVKATKHFQWVASTDKAKGMRAVEQGVAIAFGMEKMLLVANHPANICTPSAFSGFAEDFVDSVKKDIKHSPLSVKVHKYDDIRKLGMNCFLSVAQGSDEPPRMVEIRYNGSVYASGKESKKTKTVDPIVLVGKGITFDSGGISLKPGAEMDHMKWDMCGAASVLGALLACAKMCLPIDVVGIMPLTENLPSGKAVKPSDVVTTMSGLTVENLNTDAEGRLILCDALTYAQKQYKPKVLIDVATLTGACVIALGDIRMGLYANDEALCHAMKQASEISLDLAWPMPLDSEYAEGLKSNFADLQNIAGRGAGSVTAAMFLSKFIDKDTKWAHLDIAGVAYIGSGPAKGATGRPLPLLMQYLMNSAEG